MNNVSDCKEKWRRVWGKNLDWTLKEKEKGIKKPNKTREKSMGRNRLKAKRVM